jgi:hypothetical protein
MGPWFGFSGPIVGRRGLGQGRKSGEAVVSEELVIGEARKNRGEIVRVSIGRFGGRPYVYARWFGKNEGQDAEVDLHRGFTLAPDAARGFVRLLEAALAEIERRGGW